MMKPVTNCLELLMHEMPKAFFLALASAGSNMAASIAMIAITTSSSIKVNAHVVALGEQSQERVFFISSDLASVVKTQIRRLACVDAIHCSNLATTRKLQSQPVQPALDVTDNSPSRLPE
jgi:hypothetical protein